MLIHDWTRVEAGIFHHFHHAWIDEIARSLNRGLLPPDYYGLVEHIAGCSGPDVLTLQGPGHGTPPEKDLAPDQYATKAKAVVIRHTSNHRVIAIVEIISPGNKNSRHGVRAFVDKAVEMLRAGIHLLILDLFPPGRRDPQGIHKAIWDEFIDNDFALPADKPLTLASYKGGPWPEAFIEPIAYSADLPDMPLFLAADMYVSAPLAVTYQSAWEAVPSFWRDELTGGGGS